MSTTRGEDGPQQPHLPWPDPPNRHSAFDRPRTRLDGVVRRHPCCRGVAGPFRDKYPDPGVRELHPALGPQEVGGREVREGALMEHRGPLVQVEPAGADSPLRPPPTRQRAVLEAENLRGYAYTQVGLLRLLVAMPGASHLE